MSSTYVPASKLSYNNGNERATVLNDGKVMVLMVKGQDWREIMSLADWIILADGQPITWSNPPFSSPSPSSPTPSSPPAPAPSAPSPAASSPYLTENWPTGTVFKWKALQGDHSRVAVRTKTGVLQVKSVCSGLIDRTKTLYPTCMDWTNQLPHGGVLETVKPDHRTSIQRLASIPFPEDMTDPQKLGEILQRFKIRAVVKKTESLDDIIARQKELYKHLSRFPNSPHHKAIMKKTEGHLIGLNNTRFRIGEARSAERRLLLTYYGTGKCFIKYKGEFCRVGYYAETDEIVLYDQHVNSGYFSTFKTFQELGSSELFIQYRGHHIHKTL